MISKIKIENVKGYGVPGTEVAVAILKNKVNIGVAPNGFGKSSLAIAFESMNRNRLDVDSSIKHSGCEKNNSFIELTIDSNVYRADETENEIYPVVVPYVIHNRLRANCRKFKFGRYMQAKAYMDVESIVLLKEEKRNNISYSVSVIRRRFGKNGKILHPIEALFENRFFLEGLKENYEIFQRFQTKKRKEIIDDIVDGINSYKGTCQSIIDAIPDSIFATIENDEYYKKYSDLCDRFNVRGTSAYERFQLFYQLRTLIEDSGFKKEIVDRIAYLDYAYFKNKIDSCIASLNSTGVAIHAVVEEGYLLLRLPDANRISNGQRDVLTFVAELLLFEAQFDEKKDYLLIIDEVFDYLDDANTLAAQYFLSFILSKFRNNVYVLLLTHLNPYTFRNFVFNKKLINEFYLENSVPVGRVEMMSFLAFREGLDRQDGEQQKLYDNISNYLLHYHPQPIDISGDIQQYSKSKVKSSWGNSQKFRTILIQSLNAYFSHKNEYDPYAVAVALRLRMEKILYDRLKDDSQKQVFLSTHTTKSKMELCEEYQLDVSPVFYMVNSIHNEADHLKYNQSKQQFEEKSTVYKLQNGIIRGVMKRLFEYRGEDIDLNVFE